jgi:GT2 family glycosyltransferase
MADTAAVILTHGEHQSYRLILSDLLTQGLPPEAITVVHNPVRPTDPSVDAPPGVDVIRMPGNAGYAAGMNAGMERRLDDGAEWIWLVTHDVRLRAGAVKAMVTAADTWPDCGALGPLLVVAGTQVLFSMGGERTRWGRLYSAGQGSRFDEGRGSAATRSCVWLDGSSIMLRARALRDVGLYETALFGYTEDAELCWRLERAGWSVRVVGAAVAEQTSGQTSRPGPVTYLLVRNNLRYARAVVGRTAVPPMLGRVIRDSIHYARVAVTGPDRRPALIMLCATWTGVVDFFRLRIGPPPSWLPGRGDLA